MDYKTKRRLTNAAIITGLFTFAIMWSWFVATEGFLIGVILGWIPSMIFGVIAYWLAPVVWIVLLFLLIILVCILI